MTQIKSSFGPLNTILEEILGTVNNANWTKPSSFSPLVNVGEVDNKFFIEIVAPGLQKSDFVVNVENDLLTVNYDKKNNDDDTKKYHRKDFSLASFKRSFNIKQDVDFDNIEATYNNGILTVSLPKKEEEKPTPRTVEIK